jgi:hypothetical protein
MLFYDIIYAITWRELILRYLARSHLRDFIYAGAHLRIIFPR